MDFNDYTLKELRDSMEAEMAKCLGEIRCAQADLDKAQSRMRFILAVIHNLKDRKD